MLKCVRGLWTKKFEEISLKLKLFQRRQATDGQAVRNLTDNGRCWVGVVSHRVDSLGCHGENDGVGGLGQQVAVVHCTAQ